MNKYQKLYYWLTAYIPRKLPADEWEYEEFKRVLLNAYEVPDEPQVWATVAGQITSTPSYQLRKPWGHVANAAKRLAINALAHSEKTKAIRQLNEKLEELTRLESERLKKDVESGKQQFQMNPEIQKQSEAIEDVS